MKETPNAQTSTRELVGIMYATLREVRCGAKAAQLFLARSPKPTASMQAWVVVAYPMAHAILRMHKILGAEVKNENQSDAG